MKKNVLVSAAVLALGAGSMLLTGFDSAATVDEVVEKYTAASNDVNGLSADADVNMKMNLGIASDGANITLDMEFVGDMTVSYIKDPFAVSVDAAFNVTAMGEEMNMNMQMYMVPGDDGSYGSFVYTDEGSGGTWEYEEISAEQMEELQKMMLEAQLDPGKFPIEYTLADEPTDVNGSSCYHLFTSITYDTMKPILEEAMSAVPSEELDDDTMAMVESLLSGLVFNLDMDVDAESYLPLKASMNMDGSDFSAFSDTLGYAFADTDEEGNFVVPEVTMNLDGTTMDFTYDYTVPAEISVPEDALAAKDQSETSNFLDDVEDIAEETFEE